VPPAASAEVAAITEAAMRGEITDYKDSLRRRLALLRGVPVSALEAVYERTPAPEPRRRGLRAAPARRRD
jgi:phosphoserine phosphatase